MNPMSMKPLISKIENREDILTFTLSGVDVSVANSIRRGILADINTVAFITTPNEENRATIYTNTTRLNNEILKQRLSCIPIHITDVPLEDLDQLVLELNEENLTDTMYTVTTEHFKIRHKKTNTYLSEKDVRQIFPPFQAPNGVNYFIQFVRLRPKISDDIPGEKISLTCDFKTCCSKKNSMFNVVGTCAYGFTVDENAGKMELAKKQQQWKSENMDEVSYESESKNWMLLEAKRFVIKDSFDFIIQTVGVFENDSIIRFACQSLINKFVVLLNQILKGKLQVSTEFETSNPDTYDYVLENEDYTIGNILNHLLYTNYYEGYKLISYVGFKKRHPHDLDSMIRMTYLNPGEDETHELGITYIKECCTEAIQIIRDIMDKFGGNLHQIGYNPPIEQEDVEKQALPQEEHKSPDYAPNSPANYSPDYAPNSPVSIDSDGN